MHALHDDYALGRGHYGDIFSEHPDIPAVVHVGVAEEDGGDVGGGVLAYGEVCWDEVGPVDVELWKEVEKHEVVDSAGVPALQELLVELAVFAEVLPEI